MSDIHIVSNKINVSKIIDEIDMYPDHWLVDTRRQETLHEQIHTETINLVLAYDPNPKVKDVRDSHTYRPSLLCKYYPETMKILKTYFPVGLSRVAIVKLKPGKMVSPHIDLGKYYEIRHRYHLVIKGSYLYQVEEEGKQVSPGTLFWFNNKKNHSAFNNTSEDRISVIFDVEY
jgi:hypothetical protein